MSSAEEFNLRWNNHLNTISQLLGEFLNNKSLCDVTLSAEGQTISCHRVILAACSTYFQGIFNQVNDKSLVVMVKDAKFIDLKSLVDFMYYGEVSVEHDRLNSLLRTAESLKVKGLADEKKKEERILSEPPQMPVHVPQPAAVPQKRVMPPMPDSMSKRPRVSGAPSFAQSSRVSSASQPSPQVEGGLSQGSSDGVQPKQEVVELGDDGEDNGEQSYLDGDEKYDDGDSNLSGAGPSGMESGLDDSGQMEGVEGQDVLRRSSKSKSCGTCGKVYSGRHATRSLRRHVRFECNVAPQFACVICGRAFRRKEAMRHHSLSQHSELFSSRVSFDGDVGVSTEGISLPVLTPQNNSPQEGSPEEPDSLMDVKTSPEISVVLNQSLRSSKEMSSHHSQVLNLLHSSVAN